MNAHQQDVIRRVEALHCVPRFHKIDINEIIARIDDADILASYDHHGLGFVERYIEPLAHGDVTEGGSPPFARLCQHLAACADTAELAAALGVQAPKRFEPTTWFEWAAALNQTPVACLYCLANFWILPIIDHSNPQFICMALPSVVQCVNHLGRRELAVHAAESVLGINPRDYGSPTTLTAKLDAHADASYCNLIASLADPLRFVPGREARHAARLLEAWLGKPLPEYKSAAKFHESTGHTRLAVVQSWLRAAGIDHVDAIATCQAVVNDVRSVRDTEFASSQQRQDFLKNVRGIWGDLQATGLASAAAARARGEVAEAERLEQQVLVWGETFENRSLVENMLEHYRQAGRDGAELIQGWNAHAWPWTEIWTRDKVRLAWPCFRDGGGDPFAFPQALAMPLEDRDAMVADAETELANPRPLTPAEQKLRDELTAVAAREVVLEELVPVGAVWVRMLFDDRDGTLRWWAFWNEAGTLRRLASAASQPLARQRPELGNLLFDLDVERVWNCHRRSDDGSVLSQGDYRVLMRLADCCADRAVAGDQAAREACAVEAVPALQWLEQRQAGSLSHLRWPKLAALGWNLLRRLLSDKDIDENHITVFRAGLHAARNPWREPWGSDEREDRRQSELNAASEQHRLCLQREIDWQPLFEAGKSLGVDWSQMDLLLQAQGPLWTAPLSLLAFGPASEPDANAFRLISRRALAPGSPTGRSPRLFEQVASTSAAVSLTLRKLGAEHAARHAQETGAAPRRLLSAHWLEPRELMSGLAQLHAGLEWAGEQHGWSVWGAGDDPLAARAALSAMMNQTATPFDFAAFGGHGADTAGGVLFSGGVWDGGGADLSSLDLLLLVACAVGRLAQDGQRDVQGLYSRLVAQGCRAVIAARWPIADTEAAVFATILADEYLALRKETAGQTVPFLRARALNRARRLAVSEQAVTEHLAAAFDLYGYG